MMEQKIDWSAVPIICDLLGIEDPAELIDDLLTIRRHAHKLWEAGNNG